MSEEMILKACPFCGGEAVMEAMNGRTGYRIMCRLCGAHMRKFNAKEDVASAWNRRTPEPGTSVVWWVTVDLDDAATYPPMNSTVLVPVDGEALVMFYSSRPERREWIDEEGQCFAFDNGDLWAYLPEPPEGGNR